MFEKYNERLKKLNFIDTKLIKWSVFFGTIIIVKLFPQLLQINYWILILLMFDCAARPVYKFWFKK